MTAHPVQSVEDGVAATVTWLVIEQPPAPPPPIPSIPGSLTLLQSKRPPLAFYRFLIDQVGHEHHWVVRFRTRPEVLETIHDPDRNTICVLYHDGAPAGFYELEHVEPHRMHLVHFGLFPRLRGQGLGRWFLSTALRDGWRPGISALTVGTTSLDHSAALRLYQRAGFTVFHREEKVIEPLSERERYALLTERD